MAAQDGIRRAWRLLLRRTDVDRAVSEEMTFHMEMSVKRLIEEEGLSPEKAAAEARSRFGAGNGYQEECIEIEDKRRRIRARREYVSDVITDLRLAGRNMRLNPGFTIICLLIITIGIGGITTMFSALHSVVLQPLPYDEPDRLVWFDAVTPEGRANSISAEDYFDYRDQTTSFSSLGSHLLFRPGVIITGGEEPERVQATTISYNLFTTLAVTPLHGRIFTAAEEILGGPPVVILSYGLWQRRFGGDPEVVGTGITIDGASREIVGVMPSDFAYPDGVEIWAPMQRGGPSESGRGNNNFYIIGRLADGVSIDQARSEMDALATAISEEYPTVKGGWGIRLSSLQFRLYGDIAGSMILLMAAVILVLLIACANLSSLFLARVTSRRSEFAVRLSLGATKGAIVRQLMTESLTLTLLGTAGGILLASQGIRILKTLGPASLPRVESISINTTVLLVTLLASLLTAVLFGIVPARRGSRASLAGTLREGGSSTAGLRSLRTRSLLVIGQVGLSLTLLIASGLIMRSFFRMQQVDTGMESEGVITMNLQLPTFSYQDPEQRVIAFDAMLDRIRNLPGVREASATDGLPLFGGLWNGLYRVDRPPADSSDRIPSTRRFVMDGYFETIGVSILAGRTFEPTDRTGSPPVTVVSQAMVDEAFPGEDPLGKVLMLSWGDGIPLEIIGVVGNLPDYGLNAPPRPVFYLPNRQYPQAVLSLVMKVEGDPTAPVPAIRQIVHEVDSDVPITGISTMTDRLARSTAGYRFLMLLLGVFAAIAFILALCVVRVNRSKPGQN